MGGHPLEHDRRALLRCDAGRQRDQPIGRDRMVPGVAAEDAGPGHPVADFTVVTPAPTADTAPRLPGRGQAAGSCRRRNADSVDEVDAGRLGSTSTSGSPRRASRATKPPPDEGVRGAPGDLDGAADAAAVLADEPVVLSDRVIGPPSTSWGIRRTILGCANMAPRRGR